MPRQIFKGRVLSKTKLINHAGLHRFNFIHQIPATLLKYTGSTTSEV